jgi:hypothetical protein
MSDTGIYAGGYQRVRDYAESVDRLLIELKSGQSPNDETLDPVVNLLEALDNERSASAAVRTVGVLLRSKSALAPAKLRDIVTELKAKRASRATVEGLETFAAVLDEERAAISARLHGV